MLSNLKEDYPTNILKWPNQSKEIQNQSKTHTNWEQREGLGQAYTHEYTRWDWGNDKQRGAHKDPEKKKEEEEDNTPLVQP